MLAGPVEIFFHANQQVPGSYRIDVVGPAGAGQVTMSNEDLSVAALVARANFSERSFARAGPRSARPRPPTASAFA